MNYITARRTSYVPIILYILVIIGALLRFYHLGYNSLWLDEAATYTHSLSLSAIFDYSNSVDYFNPPLFPIVEFIALQIMGASEVALRFFPALFGVLTIPVAYLMGKEFHDEYTGIVTAAIFTLSPFLIYFSQEARAFSMLLFLCTILMYIYLKALKSNAQSDWIWFGLISALIFCTHFYGAVFIVSLVLFAAIQNYYNIRALLTGVAVGLFFSLPLIVLTITLYLQRISVGAPTYGLQGAEVVAGTLLQLAGFKGGYPAVIFLILIAVGFIWLLYNNKERAALLLWIVASTFLASAFASSHIPILPRYMIFLMIPFALGISALYTPIVELTSKGKRNFPLVLIFILVIAMLGVPFYSQYYTTYYKEDWRGVSRELSARTIPGDTIIPLPAYLSMPIGIYYNASRHGTTMLTVNNLSELKNATNRNTTGSTYYVITYDITVADPSLEMLHWTGWNTPIVSKYGNVVIFKG
jgi:mannosyltransferase